MNILGSNGVPGTTIKNKRLLELPPRLISHRVKWILNLTTMAIEANSPLAATLGDTCYEEYEPTREELAQLAAGQQVFASNRSPRPKRLIDLPASIANSDIPEADLSGAPMFVQDRTASASVAPVLSGPKLVDAVAAALGGVDETQPAT
jgi:hypothetical protein